MPGASDAVSGIGKSGSHGEGTKGLMVALAYFAKATMRLLAASCRGIRQTSALSRGHYDAQSWDILFYKLSWVMLFC